MRRWDRDQEIDQIVRLAVDAVAADLLRLSDSNHPDAVVIARHASEISARVRTTLALKYSLIQKRAVKEPA